MTSIKLTYFNIKGRAEPIRLAFHISGVQFEDDRLEREKWMTLKSTLPFQQLPILTVDGKTVAQSMAILKYAGTVGKLYPTDPFQVALVDQVVYQIQDIFDKLQPTYGEKDEQKKLAMRKELADHVFPKYFEGLEKVIKQYGKAQAVGDTVTIADIVLYSMVTAFKAGYLDGIPTSIVDSYPGIMKSYESLSKHPKVAQWNEMHS